MCMLQIFELNGSNVGVQVSRISSLLYGIRLESIMSLVLDWCLTVLI